MDLSFSIHGIFKVALYGIPEGIYPFLHNEYMYFEDQPAGRVNLEIYFVDELSVPEGSLALEKGFAYKDGVAFISAHEALVEIPLKDVAGGHIAVRAEKSVSGWIVLYIIEKILHLKVIEKGFCFFHAAGVSREGQATLYAAPQRGGKTQWVLEQLKAGAGFLGDDLVLVDRDGFAYAYPRGINLQIFHGKIYDQALQGQRGQKSNTGLFGVQAARVLSRMCSVWPGISRRLDSRLKEKSLLRLHVNDLAPDAVIVNKARLQKVFIAPPYGTGGWATEQWDKKRMARFLADNITFERLGFIKDFIVPFLALNDPVSRSLEDYVKKLLKVEEEIFFQVLDRCATEVVPDFKTAVLN